MKNEHGFSNEWLFELIFLSWTSAVVEPLIHHYLRLRWWLALPLTIIIALIALACFKGIWNLVYSYNERRRSEQK